MSKYDQFLVYDPLLDHIFAFQWDYAVNGVGRWLHFNGAHRWYVDSRSYISEARRRYVFLDRVPESEHRMGEGY